MIFPTLKKRILWCFSALIFFALPIMLAVYGLRTRFDDLEKKSLESSFLLQEKILLNLRKREDTLDYLEFVFQKFSEQIFHGKYLFSAKAKNDIKSRFPDVCTIYAVNSRGEVIPEVSESNPPKFVLKTLYKDLCEKTLNNPEPFEKDWKFLKSYIGQDTSPDRFPKYSQEVLKVNDQEKNHWFFYSISSNGGVFVHFNTPQDWTEMAVKDKIKFFQSTKQNASVSVGLSAISDTVTSSGPLAKALKLIEKNPNTSFRFQNTLMSFSRLKSSSILWVSFNTDIFNQTFRYRIILSVFATILFAFLISVSAIINFGREKTYFSIKWRLMILFFYASLLPLLVIFSIGWDYLDKEYDFQINKSLEKAERTLRHIDSNFPVLRYKFQNKINKSIKIFDQLITHDLISAKNKLKSFGIKMQVDRLSVYNASGKFEFCFDGKGNDISNSRGSKTSGEVMKTLASYLNNEPDNLKTALKAELLSSFGGVNIISLLVGGLGKLQDYQFSNNRSWIYLKPLYNNQKKVTHLIEMHWLINEVEKIYVENLVKTKKAIPKGMKVFALSSDNSWKASTSREFPNAVHFIGQWIELLRTTINRKDFTSSKTLFYTGIKPKDMKSCSLIALQDDSKINAGILRTRRLLIGFAVICISISVFLGILLSQKLLKPIDNLSGGVQAIERREYRFELPVFEADELGNLTKMFNHMLESLYEVSVAKEVQSQLFPANVLKIGEYSVFGKSRPASQLGGDYFDYLTVENRYLLVLIGDVTGHGVPAALVMAMAKGVVQERTQAGEKPGEVISILNKTILQNFHKQLLMTATFVWIDSQTNEVSVYNGGHPFPFHIEKNGKIQMIEAGGFPLGSKEKLRLFPKSFSLEPGGRIVLYTDGLVESMHIEINEDQFEKFQDYLASRKPLPIEIACDDYLDNHEHTLSKKPQPDDFTVVIIAREEKTVLS
ncbi:MAG: SpoIIE family protein phosphatase [Candidatus Riflebacteria bacterium]|nr:SpoIIE family protein phosphatase [Candidatus Riflebacteria bacterium]